MAVADATTTPAARPRGRVAGALAGLVLLAAAVGVYTQIGTLGLGLAPSVALLLVAVPAFVVAGAAIRRATRTETSDHTRYPFQLAYPSLAFYCAFFIVPLCFLALFAVATPLGFGGVEYGFDLGNFEAGLDPLYVDVFLRTLRSAAIGTLLIVLVGYPLAYWIARYAPENRRGLFLALIIVPFWTSFLIPEGNTEFWADNWVIPTASEHPVAAHKWIDFVLDPVNAGKEMNYHQYPVPVVGIQGVKKELANDPVINISDEQIQGYETQIETAKGLQQRNRAYTEFKAA